MWTYQLVKRSCKQAASTLRRLPSDRILPQMFGSAMPDYGSSQDMPNRVRATPRDIKEMERFFEWINDFVKEVGDRKFVFQYCIDITAKNGAIAKYLENNATTRREYDYRLNKIFQRVAEELNLNPNLRALSPSVQSEKILAHEQPVKREVVPKYKTFQMVDGARPTFKR